MIRLEVVIKDKWGNPSTSLEREGKRRILEALSLLADNQSADVVRIQFLGPKKS